MNQIVELDLFYDATENELVIGKVQNPQNPLSYNGGIFINKMKTTFVRVE